MATILFDPKGSPVQFEVFFGQAQVGRYEASLHDSKGVLIPNTNMNGNNVDSLPDIFKLPVDPKKLNSNVLLWTMMIAAPDENPGELYFSRLTFTQDGKNLEGSPVEYSGALEGEKIILGQARLVASA